MKVTVLRLVLAAVLLGPSIGIGAPDAADPAASTALTMLKSKGYKIGKSFDAGHGLIGWVVDRGGQNNVVFTTADGQLLLVGALVDDKGVNLTEGYVDQYAANPAIAKAYESLESSRFIALKPNGTPRQVVYVVFDPNCPFCSLAYKALKQYIATGVEFRWVPVAYLRADSANRISAILGAPDAAAALQVNEEQFDEKAHEGGIRPSSNVPASLIKQLKSNDAIMQSVGSSSTPTFFWKDPGGRVHDFAGLPPPEVMAQIAGITAPH